MTIADKLAELSSKADITVAEANLMRDCEIALGRTPANPMSVARALARCAACGLVASDAAAPVTPETLTDVEVLKYWDASRCGDSADNWDSDKGWSVISPEDARLAMSSVPIFGVGDVQKYWRDRDAARARICNAINARRAKETP